MFTDTLITSGIIVTVLLVIAVIGGRRQKAANATMAWVDHFKIKGFEANIDRARNEMHIYVDGQRVFDAPLGHLVVEHEVETVAVAHEKKPKRLWDGMTLPPNPRRLLRTGRLVAPTRAWAETIWTPVETGKTWVQLRAVRLPAYYAQHWASWEEEQTGILTNHLDVPLPNAKARAFKLWLDYHQRELFPDRAAVRATWDQTCAELLRACRQQRDYCESAAGAFETWAFSAEPSIAYLAIELNGTAFWASGDTPQLEQLDQPRFELAGDSLTVFSGDEARSFPVPADKLAPLQALQRQGIVRKGASPRMGILR